MAKINQIAKYIVLYCFILLTNGCLVCGLLFTRVYTDLEHHQLEESVPAASETVCAISCYRTGYDHCKMFSYINGTCGKYSNITGNITQTPSASNTPVHVHPVYFNNIATTTTNATITNLPTVAIPELATTVTEPTTTTTGSTCPPGQQSHDGRSCFLFFAVKVAWAIASERCNNLSPSAELVSIRSQQDQDLLNSMTTGYYHIGLNGVRVPGKWTWPDGSKPTYTNWASGYMGGVPPNSYVQVMSQAADPKRGWSFGTLMITEDDYFCEYFISG